MIYSRIARSSPPQPARRAPSRMYPRAEASGIGYGSEAEYTARRREHLGQVFQPAPTGHTIERTTARATLCTDRCSQLG